MAATQTAAPVQVAGGLTFTKLMTGYSPNTCGAATNGKFYCWGFNSVGQNGDGTTTNSNGPTLVTFP